MKRNDGQPDGKAQADQQRDLIDVFDQPGPAPQLIKINAPGRQQEKGCGQRNQDQEAQRGAGRLQSLGLNHKDHQNSSQLDNDGGDTQVLGKTGGDKQAQDDQGGRIKNPALLPGIFPKMGQPPLGDKG
jgi:hypothetical protein